ncbi:protein GrpE [Capnocytophaga sp. HP1101]
MATKDIKKEDLELERDIAEETPTEDIEQVDEFPENEAEGETTDAEVEIPEELEDIADEELPIEKEDSVNNGEAEDVEAPTGKREVPEEYFTKERDRYLRLFAEFENYRKRTAKERAELLKTAGQDILSAMLPIVDDFDRALVELAKSGDEKTLKGVELIYNKLVNTLKSKGLERMEVAPNDVFDSEIHDAITQIPAATPEYKGKIVDVVQTGYKLGDKIIRFPKVVVAQ